MFIAFKTQQYNPEKPSGMPNEWVWGTVIEQQDSTLPDQSGEWMVLTLDQFNAYKTLYRASYNAYIEQVRQQENLEKQVKSKIIDAKRFGDDLITLFVTENVLMGITQAGKTKPVADYLQNVMRYIQTGSLHEVVNEVNSLINAGVPLDLNPFVSAERLDMFKQKIINYLQG